MFVPNDTYGRDSAIASEETTLIWGKLDDVAHMLAERYITHGPSGV